ncbi:hypothetical protein JCM19992_03690 [Thermostilla marina]
MLDRRRFLQTSALIGTGLLGGIRPVRAQATAGLKWKRASLDLLFHDVQEGGTPLCRAADIGPLAAEVRVRGAEDGTPVRLGPQRPASKAGPVGVGLTHRLRNTGGGMGEDLLEATLALQNPSPRTVEVEIAFLSTLATGDESYVPLSASGLGRDKRFAALGVAEFLQDCRVPVAADAFTCHYLEPAASHPEELTTKALLLAPVVDLALASTALRGAFMTPSDEPMRFRLVSESGTPVWRIGRVVRLEPGESREVRCFLLLHEGDASAAWDVFHTHVHHDDFPVPAWTRDFRVHYYDFLSSAEGKGGRRGNGYEADLPHFAAFHVGLATQHGYYPTLSDYVHPDRKTWLAMQGDAAGPAEMSLEKMRARIEATRKTGAKAGIYIHPVLFDDATPFFDDMQDCILRDPEGNMVRFPWQGPDVKGRCWRASLASKRWRDHLLQQTQWIMELLDPDAIAIDETFAGMGYDFRDGKAVPMAQSAISLYREMRKIVRSFGDDKAIFGSDCSDTGFCLFTDGECGDHAYGSLLGHPLYSQQPVRYLAALGKKPWRPCAWHFTHMWDKQMALARLVGSGVGVSNGWIEYTGLARLDDAVRRRLIADIESLLG